MNDINDDSHRMVVREPDSEANMCGFGFRTFPLLDSSNFEYSFFTSGVSSVKLE